jgi:serine/threonine protein kinase
MAGGALGKSIIGFYGSYIQDGSYNILLEYADRGTLEEYLQNTPPPTTGEDIFKFWSALFNVIQALHLIHNVQGNDPSDPPILQGYTSPSRPSACRKMLTRQYSWHQDINPSNILVTSGKSGSRFDCEFKIADLGLSHFRKVRASHGAAADKDTSGTRQYGRFL